MQVEDQEGRQATVRLTAYECVIISASIEHKLTEDQSQTIRAALREYGRNHGLVEVPQERAVCPA